MVEKNEISSKQAKEVFLEIIQSDKTPSEVAKEKGMKQMSDEGEIIRIANEVLDENPKAIEDYHNGRTNMLDYLVGQVMKKSRGKANPVEAKQKMLEKI